MEESKVTVTERAVLQRVNRALAHDGKRMYVCRDDSRWSNELGRFYIVSTDTRSLDAAHADLDGWARELGVLKRLEEIKP
jgi:hypothetical protein